MNIGILGASGLIGYNLYKFLKNRRVDVLGTYHKTPKENLVNFDIEKDAFSIFDKCKQVVIAGAITSIDKCYVEKDKAYSINVDKTIKLIKYLARNNIKPIFLSSDQVFDGKKGNYTEKDLPNPVNLYGKFKFEVENFMTNNLKDYLILRLSKIYSRNLKEKSIFSEIYYNLKSKNKILAAIDQIFNPTDVETLCDWICKAIDINLGGLYHLADSKIMSRYEFALSIANTYGLPAYLVEEVDINNISFADARTLNSSLRVDKKNKAFSSFVDT